MPAGNVFENRGDAALNDHLAGGYRLGVVEARQRSAIGAKKKDSFDEIAPGLFDGKGGEVWIVETAFAHNAIDCEAHLLLYLREAEFGNGAIAPPFGLQQCLCILDGRLATFYRYIRHSSNANTSRTRQPHHRDWREQKAV